MLIQKKIGHEWYSVTNKLLIYTEVKYCRSGRVCETRHVRTTLHHHPLRCIISSVKFRVFLQVVVTGSDNILKQADLKN